MRRSWLVVFVCPGFAATACRLADAPPIQIQSTFETDTEGWTVQGIDTDAMDYSISPSRTGTASWDATGALQRADVIGITDYFQAPIAFRGDLSAYEGGTLSFRMREEKIRSPFEAPLVMLDGAGVRWRFDRTQAASLDWVEVAVPVDGAGWTRLDGVAATAAALQTSLGAVTALWIRGEYSGVIADAWLDDVTLAP